MDKDKEPVDEEFSILNLTGYLCEPDKMYNFYRFGVRNATKYIKATGIYKIPDLSKDNIYKKIFVEDKKNNGIDVIDRCKALIQSIVNKKGFLVKKLEELNIDINFIKNKHPLVATFSDDSKYIITLEMQNYFFNGLNLNELIYGNELKKKTNLPVLIIVLLIKDSILRFEDFEFEDNDSIYKELYDNVYVLCLDLYHIYYCIKRNKNPDLKGFFFDR